MFCKPDNFNLVPYSIANLTENEATLLLVIDEVESEILKKILGLTLYKEFLLGLEALPDEWDIETNYLANDQVYWGVTVWTALQPNTAILPIEGANWTKVRDDKWLKLRDGYQYKLDETSNKKFEYKGLIDLLRPMVYYSWLQKREQNQTDGGIGISGNENAYDQGIRDMAVRSWNDCARKVGSRLFMEHTLYGFLKINEEDYEDLFFEPLHKLNYFDF